MKNTSTNFEFKALSTACPKSGLPWSLPAIIQRIGCKEIQPDHSFYVFALIVALACCTFAGRAFAQPQDNWYAWHTYGNTGITSLNCMNTSPGTAATNGGISSPYGIAVGPDGRIFVADHSYGLIQCYSSNGAFMFSITNGFNGGQNFSQPLGMITDKSGNLYVADNGNNCVFEFGSNGTFVQEIGGVSGTSPGQLSGVRDVAVAANGQIYIVENGNSRVSQFNPNGTFNQILINSGSLGSQLSSPVSIAISDAGEILVTQDYMSYQSEVTEGGGFRMLKAFNTNAGTNFLFQIDLSDAHGFNDGCFGGTAYEGPCCVRVDSSGLVHVISGACGSKYDCGNDGENPYPIIWRVFNLSGTQLQYNTLGFGYESTAEIFWPCQAIGPDGTMFFVDQPTGQIQQYLYAKREQDPVPKNAPSMPEVLSVQQRTNSTIIDIYYHVTDLDDSNTFAGILIFTNGTQSLSDCFQPQTFVEGTGTNINAVVPTGQTLHLAWNAGMDWSTTNTANFVVGIIAKDLRQGGLLDFHFLDLPADHGLPALEISATPLIQSDFSQVWWWLLATNDPGISLSNGVIHGVGGAYNGLALCNGDNNTTTNGQAYIYAKMNVRQATTTEVAWASEGPNVGITNQWAPTIAVAGRPKAVNEYGFDTGNWGTNAWWIVPQ